MHPPARATCARLEGIERIDHARRKFGEDIVKLEKLVQAAL